MPYEQDMRKVRMQQMLAQMLQQQGQQGMQGTTAGGRFMAPSRNASIASALSQIGGGLMGGYSMRKEGDLQNQRKKELADQIAKMAGMTTAPPATASVEPPAPVMGFKPPPAQTPGVNPRNQQAAAALAAIGNLPVEQQESILGSQAMQQLFAKPKHERVDVGGEILTLDEGGNIVGRMPKSAAPSNELEKTIGPDGKPIFTPRAKAAGMNPYEAEPDAVRAARAFLENPDLAAVDQARKKASANTVNVNTERNLYGTMADKQGAANVDQYTQAQKAPQLLQRAQRVKQLLGPDTKAITGTGAEQLLALSKAAAQFGFNTGDAATDTEMLSRELASSTLDVIKSSGLGGGTGFSNADRDFLEKAVGGKITLEGETLRRLADLNERAALNSIKQWNATASRLDPAQLKALGMSPIEMPAGTEAPAEKPKLQQNPDGSYTYSP